MWLERYDDACIRQDSEGGEFDSFAEIEFTTITGASTTFVVSTYLPLETGQYFFEIENTP